MKIYLFRLVSLAFSFGVSINISNLEAENPFYPTWKLLSNEEKQHFIAGYLQGWSDARRVTDIAINYIKENPQKAVEGLEGIKKIYDLTALGPEAVVREVDSFYNEHSNQNASLSAAITAAKSTLRITGGMTTMSSNPYEKEIK